MKPRLTPMALGGLALAGCSHPAPPADKAKDAPLPVVSVGVAHRGVLTRTLPVTGILQSLPGKEAIITPPVGGLLASLDVRYGQAVTKGQVIAHLGNQQAQAQIQQAQATVGQNLVQVQQAEANAIQQHAQTNASILQAAASVRNAQAALAGAEATLTGSRAATHNAVQTLQRQKTLFADGLVAAKDVEAAQLSVQTAEAAESAQRQVVDGQRQTVEGQRQALAAARATALQDIVKQKDVQVAQQQVRNSKGALQAARAQLALYTVRSPLTGRVTALTSTPGTAVDPTAKLLTIADLHTLQLQINVPSISASQVRPGEELTFTVEGMPGRTFSSTILTVSPQADTTNGTVPAFTAVDNRSLALKDGTNVKVQVVVDRRVGVITVPQSAVLTDPDTGKKSVAVIGDDGTLHVTEVTTGLEANGQVEIVDGVKLGQKVAVSGQYGVADGAKVQVQPAPGAKTGNAGAGGSNGP